jgi:hypothetical protein
LKYQAKWGNILHRRYQGFFFIKTIKKPRHNRHLFHKEKTIYCVGSEWWKLFLFSRCFAFFAGNLSFGGWLLTGFFLQAGSLKLSSLILPLLQIIMFWMGTELSIKEFLTAIVFSFPKEIAAGIILVGCCPSGLVSIKTSFVTRANLWLQKIAES